MYWYRGHIHNYKASIFGAEKPELIANFSVSSNDKGNFLLLPAVVATCGVNPNPISRLYCAYNPVCIYAALHLCENLTGRITRQLDPRTMWSHMHRIITTNRPSAFHGRNNTWKCKGKKWKLWCGRVHLLYATWKWQLSPVNYDLSFFCPY